jgi:D-alanyl-D-alanine carboxypeptidase
MCGGAFAGNRRITPPRFSDAEWGAKIASLATGKTIYQNHAGRLMRPATNSKLCASALVLEIFAGD